MEQIPQQHDYILTLFEVCETLNKSSRTISRYVHKNILHPVGVKSRQGTLEYRFSRSEVEELKKREEQVRQMNFPNLITMDPGVASFASLSYPPATSMPRPQFAIPGVMYPSASGQTQGQSGATDQTAAPSAANPTDAPVASPADPVAAIPSETVHVEELESSGLVTDRDNKIITLLKETTEMLRGQLRVKDDQIRNLDEKIGQLIERNRETNILLKGLQDKMVLLEKPKSEGAQARSESPASPSEEVRPAAAPSPSQVPPVRIRVAYSDAVPQADIPDAADDNGSDGDDNDWQGSSAKNGRSGSKGFFGKMFH